MNELEFLMAGIDNLAEFKKKAKEVFNRPIPPNEIKERDAGGGKKLKYVDGTFVISVLNEATDGIWSFKPVETTIIQSEPKPMYEYDKVAKQRKPVLNADGSQKMEDQPPFLQIKGQLIVPGFGIKEQYGTKVLIGGASEQESSAKAAATDAFKKCATLLGIGKELYENKEEEAPQKPSYNNNSYNNSYNKAPAAPAKATPAPLPAEEVDKIKELKKRLSIDDNGKLIPYIAKFLRKAEANSTVADINASNISDFNKFLEKQITGM